MRAQASLEGTGGVLRALVVMEDEAAVVWRTLPANRLPYRVDRDLLGDAPGHRPARGLAGEGVYRGCETEPPFALCFVKFLSTNSASWFRRNLQSCRPPPERRVLDSELPRKVDGPHLAAEDHPRRRYLELLIVTLPLLGHIEHLSPLTWCPGDLTLSNLTGPIRSNYLFAPPSCNENRSSTILIQADPCFSDRPNQLYLNCNGADIPAASLKCA